MGLVHGVGVEEFVALCRITDPAGQSFVNPCIGCDLVHERFLGPVLAGISKKRRHGRPA
jgi:hypothetical protein